jgi:predicted TIM-barrel fold metal-dependent hydrolase
MKNVERIVDPHQHFWKLGKLYYPWLMDEPPLVSNPEVIKDYLPGDYFSDARDLALVKSVHVEALPHSRDRVAETVWLQGLADQPQSNGFPHGIVAAADLTDDGFAATIAEHARFPNLRGFRQILNPWAEPASLMRDERWRTNFNRLSKTNLTFDLQVEPSQMDDAARLAADFPNVRIALNHTGWPELTSEEASSEWHRGMRLLAPYHNVSVKLSGFGMLDHNCSVESIRPVVLETIDVFGPSRCMFASNFPVCQPYISFHDLWAAYLQITKQFSDEERGQLFHDNAIAFYRL